MKKKKIQTQTITAALGNDKELTRGKILSILIISAWQRRQKH